MLSSTPKIQYREHWRAAPGEREGRGHSDWQGFSRAFGFRQRRRESVRLEPNEFNQRASRRPATP